MCEAAPTIRTLVLTDFATFSQHLRLASAIGSGSAEKMSESPQRAQSNTVYLRWEEPRVATKRSADVRVGGLQSPMNCCASQPAALESRATPKGGPRVK